MFALLSRIFAVQENLYPVTARYKAMFRYITLESGLVFGLLLFLAGFALALYTLLVWRHESFGELNLMQVSRIVIPAATALALGVEVMLFSFFLSTLGLNIRHYGVRSEDTLD
jgi:hypothetical protein